MWKSIFPEFFLSFLCLSLLLSGCKQDASTQTEEESAYMADYEAPSDHWGFIDSQGNLVIKAEYDDVGPFSEGLAAVSKQGKWGYINSTGQTVIEPAYKSAWAFHEGYARVLPFDSTDNFIFKEGNAMPAENWSAADDFSDGLARVKVGNLFGYINSKGKLVIQPLYTRGWNFSNSICVIEYQDKLGVIDRNGNNILKPEYDQIKKVADGQILLCRKSETAIAYDAHGKELVRIPGGKMVDSNNKLISVRQGNNMYLVTISSPTIQTKAYANIIYLEEDRWAGKKFDGYVLLDADGNEMNGNNYTQINKFSYGFAAYSKNKAWGYIDTSGTELTEEVFGLAWDYKEGFARAAFQEGIAFIDLNQDLAFYPPPGSLDMRDFSEGLASVLID